MSTPADNNMKLAALIAKTMQDSGLRSELISSPDATLKANGVSIADGTKVTVVEDGPNHLNVVVPSTPIAASGQVTSIGPDATLSDIYRWAITQVQTDGPHKNLVMSDPADAARAAGANIPADLTATILVDTDTHKHIVLPWRPAAGTDVAVDDSAVAAVAGGKSATSTYEVQTAQTTTTVQAEAEVQVAGAVEVAGAAVVVAVAILV